MQPISYSTASLLVVDVQQGFTSLCPNELPVPGGEDLVEPINRLLELPWKRIDATQDWHPDDHCSFLGQRENLYPAHCVMNTPGADFLPGLHTNKFHTVWRKGFHSDFEAYAVTAQHSHFGDFLRAEHIDTVAVCGLAKNICCFYSARDLKKEGFRVLIIEDASAGIDVAEADLLQDKAEEEGKRLGIEYVRIDDIVQCSQE